MHLQGLPPLPKSLASFKQTQRPIPPPRPHSRRSSSSGSSFRASPEHCNPSSRIESLGISPLSSSPHSPHVDSGFGRSSVDSFNGEKNNALDTGLAQLKRDMGALRVSDMNLLGHLLQINQGLHDLKQLLIPPPQPAPSHYQKKKFHKRGSGGGVFREENEDSSDYEEDLLRRNRI